MNLAKAQDTRTEIEKQEAHWQRTLGGELPIMQVYPDHPRPPVSSFIRGRESVDFDHRLCRQIRDLCIQENVTLFIMLLTAFKTLLLRHTGQVDIIVGSPSSDSFRWTEEKSQQTFSNLLALRTSLAEDLSFVALLHRVTKTVEDAAASRDYPFEELVEVIHGHHEVSIAPIFQVMFALCNAPFTLSLDPITEDQLVNVEDHSNRCDLVFLVCPKGEILNVTCEYDAELFESATITRHLGQYQIFLDGIVAHPEERLSQLPILSQDEKYQLLVEWNDTKREFPTDTCIHELFEKQVERSPDSVAIVFENQQLTYGELNQRANQLGHYLQKLGVGPETLVGICMERSIEMVVGLLGILKAGGAYVPLDPEYPDERLRFMLEDTKAPLLLSQKRLVEELIKDGRSRDLRVQAVSLDTDWEVIAHESKNNPSSETTAENLAYVIYTSGSTGKPKGVEILHRGIARLLFGVDYAQLGANQTFLHLASTAFDASTFEIWGALLHGAKCVLYPGAVPIPRELGEMLSKHNVSTLWLTASLFNTVIDEAPEALSGVRQLLIGGEALSVPHVRRALSLLPETKIINGYGPTESTTFTCCYPIPRQLDKAVHSVPIGRPIGNTSVYILDQRLNPVPIGTPGEIYIGGAGLARGYLNRAELTAEKFIVDPFGTEAGARLYRTGDRARYLSDGNIEFLGRLDDQVKIRGFRIELGEIEAVLSQHPTVREIVVLAHEEPPADPSALVGTGKRLLAYVVPKQGAAATTNDLRDFLKPKLPDYMIPSVFVFLNALPLTPNGKVNRRALPAPDQSRPELEEPFLAPRTPVEKRLTEIWAEVLKLDKVGIRDNFFDVGGHSLLATQVVSRILRSLHAEVPLRTMFDAPTVEQMSAIITEQQAKKVNGEDLNSILGELESLSDENAQERLAVHTEKAATGD